jgi:hypothetical protein
MAIQTTSTVSRARVVSLIFALLVFGFSSVFWSVDPSAAAAAEDPCLAGLPVPTPTPPAVRVVQLVNCSDQTLLGAANAAHAAGQPATPVFPREGTWVMGPASSSPQNVLTIDIPPEWADTSPSGSIGPNIWVRTGCRYDIAADIAQCETGGAGGVYDTSKAQLGPPGAVTFTEWNFYQKSTSMTGATYYKDNFDISLVNGASLTMDIQAVGGSARDPGNHDDLMWLALTPPKGFPSNSPMSVYGDDLRADDRCPAAFRLLRSQLTSTGTYGDVFGYVIEGDNEKPVGGDSTVACFSNCGEYKFPLEPSPTCTPDPTKCSTNTDDPKCRCYNWKTFCAQGLYGQPCPTGTDAECAKYGVNAACYQNPPGNPTNYTCEARAFIHAATCAANICTFPYGYTNPYTNIKDYSTQPPFGHCKTVDPANTDALCIGDDRVHTVFPHAYSWPNDPQVYGGDAPLYRVIAAPGGTTVPITPAEDSLPLCSSLPSIYNYTAAYNSTTSPATGYCSGNVNNGAIRAIARVNTLWSCVFAGAGNDGVICRWK